MIDGIIGINRDFVFAVRYTGYREAQRFTHPFMGEGTLYRSETPDASDIFVPDIAAQVLAKLNGNIEQAEIIMTAYFLIASTQEWGVEDYGKRWREQLEQWSAF